MTVPTVQPYTPGQCIDGSRSLDRPRIYAGVVTSYTLSYTVDTTGTASYKINGKDVSADFTVPPDDANTVAGKVAGAHVASLEAFRIANATAATNVVTIQGRTSYDQFTITDEFITAAGTNAVVLANTTPTKTDLELGIMVAREGDGAVRKLAASDVAVQMFGVSIEKPGSELKLNTGDPADEDVYEVGAAVDVGYFGEFPVRVETSVDVDTDLQVWVRLSATGDQVVGGFATSDQGNGTWLQLTTGVAWSGASYFDSQGRQVAFLTLSLP